MKRLCSLLVLLVAASSAHADSISFSVAGHRIRVEAPRNCRSSSCASITIPGVYESRRGRWDDEDRDVVAAPSPSPPQPAPAVQPPPPVQQAPQPAPAPKLTVVMVMVPAPAPLAIYKPAATTTQEVAPPPPPAVQPPQAATQPCPPAP